MSDVLVKVGHHFSSCPYITFLARGEFPLKFLMEPSISDQSSEPPPGDTFRNISAGLSCGSVAKIKIIKCSNVVAWDLSEPGKKKQKGTNSDKGHCQSHVISFSF